MKIKLKLIGIIALALLSLGGVGASYYWYSQYQQVVTTPQAGSPEEVKMLVKKLSVYIDLPEETPSVVTITDREKLQNQEFFKKAKNGDKIIIFEKTRRIILYRPADGRIIDVAPLVFDTQTGKTQQLNTPPINEETQSVVLPTFSPSPTGTSSASSSADPVEENE